MPPEHDNEALGIVVPLQREVLQVYRSEFDHLSSSFRDIDSKAQGNSSIAGILLAAVLAFVNRGAALTTSVRATAVLAVLCFIASLLLSLYALTVRELTSPPTGRDASKLLRDLRAPAALVDIRQREPNFYGDLTNLWTKSIEERRMINRKKAMHVRRAQSMLVASAAFAAAIILTVLLGG